jgi:thiol-disulfide isomerase/thioredoxin
MPISSRKWLAVLLLVCSAGTHAAELLYFFAPSCGYCRAFDAEVAAIYPRTDAAVLAPMKRIEVDPDTSLPLRGKVVFEVTSVPTFVLVEDSSEIARFEGYTSDELFWMSMERMLNLLESYRQAPPEGTE